MSVRDEVLALVRKLLAERPQGNNELIADEQTTLTDLGVDSIDLAVIFGEFEAQYDMAFDNEEVRLGNYDTLGSLADLLAARVAARSAS